YPPAFLFGGQPISPGTPTKDSNVVPALGLASSEVAGVPANVVLLLQVPPRHRLSAVLSGLEDDAQLALAVLNGDAISTADGDVLTSTSPGTAPEAVQLRNPSLTDPMRAILVVGRVDQRETKNDDVVDVPFSLLAQLAAGPEFDGTAPISRANG